MSRHSLKTLMLASLALVAFAGNSVLCRLALAEGVADPASFTAVRLASGAIVLMGLLAISSKPPTSSRGSWLASIYLLSYAGLFSFAYVSLDTATGALILFGAVQLTMIIVNIVRGQSLQSLEWCGFLLAVFGLVYLLLPEISKPSISGFLMMLVSGIAWAGYTLKGQGSVNALADTAFNFSRTLPLLALLMVPILGTMQISAEGLLLAFVSGALTSGVGYAIWYSALRGLSTTRAAVIQLLVPILAAIGGVLFANEELSTRLVVAAGLVLGGIMLVISSKSKTKNV